MSVHLVNPSDNSFGTAVITPRWLFVLAAATPRIRRRSHPVDESLEQIVPESIQPGDIVGISVHTGNALRGYAGRPHGPQPRRLGRLRRHSRHALSRGSTRTRRSPCRRQRRWRPRLGPRSSTIASPANPERIYDGGRIEGSEFLAARWDLMTRENTCGPPCKPSAAAPSTAPSAASGAPTARSPASATFQSVIDEIVDLRRLGFRFIALADDNFYPVTLTDLRLAREQNNTPSSKSSPPSAMSASS